MLTLSRIQVGLLLVPLVVLLTVAGSRLAGVGASRGPAMVPPLARVDNQLQVDGHTNQLNVSTAPYPSGWELSSARASSVVRYLIEQGHLAAHRLSAAGYSDQRPLLPPSDPRSVTRNRRVDIVVLSKLPASARASLVALGATAGSGG